MSHRTQSPGYDVLADALVWSDEYPKDIPGRHHEFDCIKLLLRYRTTLLLGAPNDFFRPYWERGKELFPNWAGFCIARLTPTEELRKFYERRKRIGENYTRRLARIKFS